MIILHLVNKVGLNQVRFLAVIRALDGDEEYVDAGLPSETRRLLHLVCGPAVHQHHGHVGSSTTVSIGVTEVLPVDVGQGLSCQGTRGRQGDSYKDATAAISKSVAATQECIQIKIVEGVEPKLLLNR